MSIVLPVLAVLALAGFAVVAAVLATVAARSPERAATMMVVVVAGSAVGVVAFALLVLGVGGMEEALDVATHRRRGSSPVHPVRAVIGLGIAGALLAIATWLVRTGAWSQTDGE